MASEKIIAKKEEQVNELTAKIKDASIVLVVNFRGISVSDDTALRKSVREAGAEYRVIKNNITKRALEACGIKELDDVLTGPSAVIIAQEEYLPALKAIYSFAKDNDFYKIKGGVLEGKVTPVEDLITLAKLPSREELIAKLAGCLLANVSKLAATLDAVRAKKEEEAK